MNRTPDGEYLLGHTYRTDPGRRICLSIPGGRYTRVGDPLSEKVLDPWNDSFYQQQQLSRSETLSHRKFMGIVSVFQTAQAPYVWAYPDFTPPAKRICSYMNCWCVISWPTGLQLTIDSLGIPGSHGRDRHRTDAHHGIRRQRQLGYNPAILRHWINTTVPVKPSRPLWTVATHEVLPSS